MNIKTSLQFIEKLFTSYLLILTVISTPVLAASSQGINRAIEVKNLHATSIMHTPGVVGIGVGLSENGQAEIKVLTTHIGVDNIPDILDGVRVKKQVTGMIIAYSDPDPTAWFPRPVPIGVSTGHPDVTAGTIGARITDGTDVYALSNNHVYANLNKAHIGDSILQPGSYDGGASSDVIGTLHEYIAIDLSAANFVDAAIALVNDVELNCATPSDGYGKPSTTIKTLDDNSVGLAVQKYGRTTGHTRGHIALLDATIDVCYETQGPIKCKTSANFIHQVGVADGSFSAGGDSGSLIVTDDTSRQAVALLFAGSSNYTFASPIETVLESFTPSIPGDFTIDNCSTAGSSSPNADFTYIVDGLVVTLTDSSTNTGGNISERQWTSTGTYESSTTTGSPAIFTYENYGTYEVGLTVTDDVGNSDSMTKSISLVDPFVITLSTLGYKVKGKQKVELTWDDTDIFDIYRNGNIVGVSAYGLDYTDNIDQKGNGTYVYKICRATTQFCSANSTVIF